MEKKFGLKDSWHGIGWEKAKNPLVQKELAAVIRKNSISLRSIVNEGMSNRAGPENLNMDSRPAFILGSRKIEAFKSQGEKTGELNVFVSTSELRSLNISSGANIDLRFGGMKVLVKIHEIENRNIGFGVSQPLMELLGLPNRSDLTLRYNPMSKELSIGPVIGIAAGAVNIGHKRPFGDQTDYQISVLRSAKENGAFAYVFDPLSIKPGDETIEGLVLGEKI